MTDIKPPSFSSVEEALATLFGGSTKITQTDYVPGGDINQACRMTLNDGTYLFMKSNTIENKSFFTVEAAGLSAIASTKAIRTPRILCCGTDENRKCSFLLLEYITEGNRIPRYWETFAHQLAAMHRAPTDAFVADGLYGFTQDNYIGAGKQVNTPHKSWRSFFRDCRLEPQFNTAAGYFHSSDKRKIERLLDRIEELLIEPERPSLLHGDLWSGNVITGSDGKAWLIDPAVYVGHAEADLAMTELFGGFPHAFYSAYREAATLQPGYEDRRDLYNLYHLLNHLNLFGPSYLSSVRRILDYYCTRH